jgi:hypothetical protein
MKDSASKSELYSLISLEEFKALMGVDDRDDRLCRFCLVTATLLYIFIIHCFYK